MTDDEMEKVKKKIVGKAYDYPKKIVKKYAQSDQSILLLGETGSGKELFADLYIKNHKSSEKKDSKPGNRRTAGNKYYFWQIC